MSLKQSNLWHGVLAIISGSLLFVSWAGYISSGSDIAAWALIIAHVLMVFIGYWDLVNKGRQNKQVERFSLVLITVGNIAIAGSMFDTLVPISGISMSIVAVIGWFTFFLGYCLLGIYLLRTESDIPWVGIPFLLSISALFIALIGKDWTLVMAAIVLGMACIGSGTILLGVAQYFRIGATSNSLPTSH